MVCHPLLDYEIKQQTFSKVVEGGDLTAVYQIKATYE
jgi:hypothetical protein